MSNSDTKVSDDFYCLGDVLMDSFLNPKCAFPMSTGFNDLDALFGGWHTGEFILLSGRPAMGRTGLGLSIIKQYLKNSNLIDDTSCIDATDIFLKCKTYKSKYSIGSLK